MKIDKSFNIIAMLSVRLVIFFTKKLSNYRKLTTNQPIASYCRYPN